MFGMERTFSVDDLMGNLWKLGHSGSFSQLGMSRTDSEAAFQDFLRKIPSATNLNQAGLEQQQLQFQQHVAHQLQIQQQAQEHSCSVPGPTASGVLNQPLSMPLPAPGPTLEEMQAFANIPRVSSLDLLRQYVVQQNPAHVPQGGAKAAAAQHMAVTAAAAAAGKYNISAPPAFRDLTSGHPASSSRSAVPAAPASASPNGTVRVKREPDVVPLPPERSNHASVRPTPVPTLSLVPELALPNAEDGPASLPLVSAALPTYSVLPLQPGAVLPAAAVTLGTLPPVAALRNPSIEPVDGEQLAKVELRRARRMLSNRESARRSRRRKQEHLHTLEEQIHALNENSKALENKMVAIQANNDALTAENMALRRELEAVKGVGATLVRPAVMLPVPDVPPPPKRLRLDDSKQDDYLSCSGSEGGGGGSRRQGGMQRGGGSAAATAAKHSSDTSSKSEMYNNKTDLESPLVGAGAAAGAGR